MKTIVLYTTKASLNLILIERDDGKKKQTLEKTPSMASI